MEFNYDKSIFLSKLVRVCLRGGILRRRKEDDIYLKFGHFKNSDKFFLDRLTDRQTDIVDRHCGS